MPGPKITPERNVQKSLGDILYILPNKYLKISKETGRNQICWLDEGYSYQKLHLSLRKFYVYVLVCIVRVYYHGGSYNHLYDMKSFCLISRESN